MSMNMRDSIRRFFAFLLATMMLFGQLPLDQVSFALGEEAPAAVEESVPEPEHAPAPEPEAPAPAPQEQAAEPEAPAPAPQEQAAEPEAPAPAPQEQPAEPEVTAVPAQPEITAAPEATAEPAVTEQPEATEQPEETAAPEATEEPTATPEATEEPTAAPFSLSALTAGANKVQVGQKVSFSFQAEGAEQLSYQILLSGGEVASGAASDGQFAFTPAKSGAYTAVVTASRGEETLSESASFLAVDGDVSVSVSTSQLYGFASSKSIDFTASVSGGAAPYSLVWKVTANGSSMHESAQTLEQAGYAGFSYMPITSGDHTVTVLVRDAAGQTAEAAGSLPVAMKDRESRAEWERTVASVQLSGNWQNDLIAIARTQIGYAESKKDFEITDDGARHGWTRYGAWYGAEYGEWCAMFVSFCLNYAGIPESAVPRGASTSAWMNAMKGAGLFRLRSEGYKPAKGDIVFISTAKNGIADHVGMVERVGADVIETIEGNTPEAVVRRVRELDSYSIVGYASMEQAMKNARVWEQFHPATAQPDETAVPEATEAPATEQPEATETPATSTDLQPEATDIPATSTDLLPEEPSTMTDLPEIDPEIEVVVADAETGILVTFAHKALPEGVDADKVVLRVLPVAPDQLVALQAQMSEPNAETKAIAYDITLVNAATGEEFQPLHPVSVSMPVPADFDGELSLYHVADEAKAEPEQVEIEQAGDACVFEASSFSVYMLMNLKARDAATRALKTINITKHAITKADGTPIQTVGQSTIFHVLLEFNIPDGSIKENDTVYIGIPAEFKFIGETSFPVKTPDGSKLADATIDPVNKRLVMKFTDYAQNHNNVSGKLDMSMRIDPEVAGKTPKDIPMDLDISGIQTYHAGIVKYRPTFDDPNEKIIKWGRFNANNKRQVDFFVRIHAEAGGSRNIVATDEITAPGATFIKNSFKVVYGEWYISSGGYWAQHNKVDQTNQKKPVFSSDNKKFTLNLGDAADKHGYWLEYSVELNHDPLNGEMIVNNLRAKSNNFNLHHQAHPTYHTSSGGASGYLFTIKLTKKDNFGATLPQAVFDVVRDSTGESVGTITTGTDGTGTLRQLLRDNYTLTELTPPSGYDGITPPIHITAQMFDANPTVSVEATNKAVVDIPVTKKWTGGGTIPEAGVKINLYADEQVVDTVTLTAAPWTHTFAKKDKFRADHTPIVYRVDEEPIAGFEKTVQSDGAGGFVITNNFKPLPVSLALPIRKTVNGDPRPAGEKKQFTFMLAAVTAGAPMPSPATVTIEDSGTASLPAITFTKAETYRYTLTETNGGANGYQYDTTPRTIEVTVTNNNGQLAASWNVNGGTAAEVAFTNQYKPAAAMLELPVTKTITGNPTPANKTFTFTLAAANGAPMPAAATTSVVGATGGKFGAIRYTTAGVYRYTVTERNDHEPGYTYDNATKQIAVTVTDTNGTLNASYTVDGQPAVNGAQFTNEYKPSATSIRLPVTKKLAGQTAPSAQNFTFTLAAVNGAPMPAMNTVTVNGAGSAQFGEIAYTAAGVYRYTVVERDDHAPGYVYDGGTRQVVVTVTDTNGTLNASYQVDGQTTVEGAVFTNTYTPSSIKVKLPVTKKLTGSDTPENKVFTFNLATTNSAPMPASATTTVTGAGSGEFGEITYTAVGEYQYTVSEIQETVQGYTFDNSSYTVTVTVSDDNGQLKAAWKAKKNGTGEDLTELLFTNKYEPAPVNFTLPIKKTITGNPRPVAKQFTFNLTAVTADAPMPSPTSVTVTGEAAGSFAAIKFTKAGDYTYKLKEAEGTDTGYTYDTAERTIIVTVTDDNGTLKTSYKVNGTPSTTGVTFTNQYKPTAAALEIPVKKLITGNDTPADKTFTFTIAASGSAPVPASLSTTVTGASTGKFGAISFTEAGVYNYTVRETNGGEPGYTYDTTAHAVQVTVTDTNGVLSASFKVDTATETHVTFTNTYKPKAATLALPVKKALEGNTTPTNKVFTFKLKTTDSSPMPTPATAQVTGAGESAFSAITFTKAGKYHYELTEENSGEAGYQYDNKTYAVEVTVTDTNGTLSAKWAATLGGEDATELLFTNRYEPTAATVQIPVKKILAGNTAPSVKTFSFTLEAVTADAPMPDTATVSVNGAGQVSFGVMSYSKAATYTYKLKENGGSEPGYQYDGTTHNITVTVRDVNGVLQAAWQMDGTTVDAVPFTNTYTPASVKVKLPVTKKLTGSETPENKVFTFNLATTNSAPMPASATTTVTGAGSGEFGEINFTAAGDYRYTVTETDSHEPGYEYDASTRNVLVKVTDTNGVLSAEVRVDGAVNAEGAVFTNKYTPASATLEIPVRKKITGNQTPADKNFTFRITAISSGAPMPAATLLNITGANMAKFREIKFTKAGEYQYKISETQGTEPGYTYDGNEHTVTVTVKDTNGTLGVTYKVDDTAANEVVFTNEYKPAAVKVTLPVKKVVQGNPRPAGEKKDFVFTLAAVTANAPMPSPATVTINDEGEASFGEINYSAAGEYKYTLKETHSGEPGYDYDTDVRNITVKVKDTNGRLSAAWTVDDQTTAKIQFTNIYTPTPVNVTLPVRKSITGKPRPAGEEEEFTFTLSAVTSGAPMPADPVVKITDEGTRSFGAIRYTKAGVFTYTLTEKQGTKQGYGYDTAPRRIAVTVTDTNGVLSASWTVNSEEKDDVLFTNTYNPAAITVTLPVKKEIEGNNRPNGGKKTFTFKLEALSEGAPMPATDEITITDAGQASFSAISYDSAGDYIYKLTEIDGQEHGYSYDLTEREITVSVKDNAGKLSATWTVNGQTQTPVLFKNRYTPDPVSLVVPVKKAITGNERPTGQEATFTFTLAAASAGAPLPNPATVTITDEGDASFAPITFTAAGRYNYTLTETDAAVGGYTYDKAPRQLAATVTDTDGVLSVTWTVNGQTKDNVLFTNTYTPTPAALALPVRKVITGNPRPESAKQTFTFTLAAVTAGAPMPSPATVTIRDEGTANFANIRYTKAGEYTYTLKETEGSAAGYQYDTAAREVKVKVTDTNGVLSAAWEVTGKTDPEATFTNHYEPAKSEVAIPVRKKITGHSRPTGEEQTFTFTLAAVTAGAPMPSPATVTITDEGTATFEAISFAEAKVYEYTLTETNAGVSGYQYDTAVRNIKVTVTDNGGSLRAVWTSNNAAVTEVLFTNTYTPAPVELKLPVEKRIEPITPPTEKTFAFKLTAEGGAPMPANAVGGTATLNITGAHQGMFDAIKFTKAGVYTYKVKETDGGETGYTYDTTEHTVTVTVTDHNGQLSAAWKIGTDSPTHILFTNRYRPQGVLLQLPVSKSFTGNARPTEKKFIFEIAAVTPGAPMPDSLITEITGAGSAKFGAINYTEIGQWQYNVTERNTHEAGYTYANTTYTVTVRVTDVNGKLQAAWENDQHIADDMPFVNNYTPAPVALELPVVKQLTGNPTPSDKTFTFTLSAVTAGAPMPASAQASVTGAGTATFGAMTYTAAGEYIYSLKEENGGETGYTYDNKTHRIKVKVTDIGGSLKVNYAVDNAPMNDEITPPSFTNQYAPIPVKVTVPVTKLLTGQPTPSAKNFVFKLTALTANAPMPEGNGAKATSVGASTVNFGELTFTAAGDYSYLVEEIEGHDAGYAYDQAKHRVEVRVTDNNGRLSATWTSDGATVGSVEFMNVYTPEKAAVSFPVRKMIPGDPTPNNKNFLFTLTAVGAAPMPDNAVSGVSTLTIAGAGASAFGIITYEEAGTFRYKVKETNSGATGYTYDTTEYDVTVTVTDHQGVLKATWSSPQGNELVFKNPYAPIPVDVVFPVRKTVEEVSPVPSPENFVFELVAATAGAPMPAGSSVTISGSGTAAFGSIHYLHAGVYEYRLTERDDHAPGYKYDTKARRIKVVVTDNDGTLEAVWTINGKTATEAEFVNKYEPEPVELPLMAKKIMKGRRLKANMFMFVLKDDAGNILQTVGNAKNGDIVFEPLRYTKPGVHTYKVSEVQGSRFGTTYDTTVHTFTVTVTDAGGKLKAEMNIPMENLKWTNTFKAKVPYTGDGANTHPWLYAMGAMAMMTLILAIMGQKRRRASK